MARSEPDDQRVKSTLSRLLQFAQPVIKSGDESDRRGVGSCFSKIFEFGVAKLLFCWDLPLGKFDAQTFRSKQKGQLASAKTQYVVTGLNPAATQRATSNSRSSTAKQMRVKNSSRLRRPNVTVVSRLSRVAAILRCPELPAISAPTTILKDRSFATTAGRS